MRKKQIILIYPKFSTFVEKDFLSLEKKARVIKYEFHSEKQIFKFTYELVRLFLFLLKNINKTDILYSWFAGFHSLLPAIFSKVFNKKMVIITGGTDAVSIPEIEYGIFYKKNMQYFFTKSSYKLADMILPVNKSLINSVNYYVDKKGVKVGIMHFVKNVKAKIVELPTGYDSDKWIFKEGVKEQTVLTVAGIDNIKTYKRKGIDLFIETARLLKDVKFIIIGVSPDINKMIQKDKPNNLVVHEYIENSLLVNYIAKSKVYCQFSLSEGLPNALCEAMLCECIPVGSNASGIPDGIGDSGFILKERDANKAASLIEKALNAKDSLGKEARQHIINNFLHEKREQSLYKLLELE